MRLSVIIPVLDVGYPLVEQLDALVHQEHDEPWEIVLSDNGSSDELTLRIMHGFARVHPNVRVVDASAIPGRSAALNAGVLAATGDVLAFCDGDDVVAPGWVAAISSALSQHTFVCGPLEYDRLNPPWAVQARAGGPDQVTGPLHIPGGPPWPFALGANIGVRRTAHEDIGGYEEELLYGGEDIDYAWRLAERGVTLQWVPSAMVHYRNRLDLGGIYRQARAYSAAHIRLQPRWGHVWPVPPVVPEQAARRRRTLRTLRQARSRGALGFWVWQLGWNDGHVLGTRMPPVAPLPLERYGRSGHLREQRAVSAPTAGL